MHSINNFSGSSPGIKLCWLLELLLQNWEQEAAVAFNQKLAFAKWQGNFLVQVLCGARSG